MTTPARETTSPLIRSPYPDGVKLVTTPHGHFGDRRPVDVTKPRTHTHQGIDLSAPMGTPILACANGIVVAANPGIGQLVRKVKLLATYKDRTLYAIYADLGTANVEEGDRVTAGDVVAHVGRLTFHHFAIRLGEFGDFLDPAEVGTRVRERVDHAYHDR